MSRRAPGIEPGQGRAGEDDGPHGDAERRAAAKAPAGRLGRLALYGSTRSVVEGLLGVRGIALAALLGPQLFGVWALFRLVLTYAAFAGFGLLRGLELEVAKARGSGDDSRRAWGRTAAGFTLAVFGTITVTIAGAAGLAQEPWLRGVLWGIAATLLVERLWFFGLTYLRAAGSLGEFAVLELTQAAAQTVLTVGLAFLLGLEGAFIGFALANLAALALLFRRAPFRPMFEPARLRTMLTVGLPLTVTLLLTTLLATVDRLIVGAVVGIEALGQYAFAVAVATVGATAALIVRTVVFPEVYGRLGTETAAGITRDHLEDTIRPFVLVLAPMVGATTFVLGPAVAWAVPQYLSAVPAAGVFIFTGVAHGAANLALLGVVATGQQKQLPTLALAALVLNAGLSFGALALGLGLAGLAAGALIGRLGYAFGVLALVARAADLAAARTAFSILWPILWCTSIVLVVSAWQTPEDLSTLARALGGYALGVAPVGALLVHALLRVRRRAAAAR